MPDIGAENEIIASPASKFMVGTDNYTLKQVIELNGKRNVFRDAVAEKMLKNLGKGDHNTTVKIYATAPDIAKIIQYNSVNQATKMATEHQIKIILVPKSGSAVTISGSAIMSDFTLGTTDPEGKVTIDMTWEYTQDQLTVA